MKPIFSIIIPTLNEEEYLPHLLDNLSAQTFQQFEVIHIDGKSEDDTVKIVSSFSEKLQIKTFVSDKKNVSHQRNLGGEQAHGEWLIFMDADVQIPSDFLEGVQQQLQAYPDTDIFTCWMNNDSKEIGDQAIALSMNLNLEINFLFKSYCAFGSMIGVKKSAFVKSPFDVKKRVLEDTYFVRDLTDLGFRFHIFKDPKYQYSLRRVKKEGTLKMLRDTAMMQLKLMYGEKMELKEHIYPMLGGKYYQDDAADPLEKNFFTKINDLSKEYIDQLMNEDKKPQ